MLSNQQGLSWGQIFCIITEFPIGSKFHFSRIIFTDKYILKIQRNEIFISLILFYFQLWNSNWDIEFSSSSLHSKLGFLNVVLRLYFKLFPNPQKDWRLGFVNVALAGLFKFFQFMKDMEYCNFWMLFQAVLSNFSWVRKIWGPADFHILSDCRDNLSSLVLTRGRANLQLNCQFLWQEMFIFKEQFVSV